MTAGLPVPQPDPGWGTSHQIVPWRREAELRWQYMLPHLGPWIQLCGKPPLEYPATKTDMFPFSLRLS